MPVAVDVMLGTSLDFHRIRHTIRIAVVLALVRDSVFIDVEGGSTQDVVSVFDAIGIAVLAFVPDECPTPVGPGS